MIDKAIYCEYHTGEEELMLGELGMATVVGLLDHNNARVYPVKVEYK